MIQIAGVEFGADHSGDPFRVCGVLTSAPEALPRSTPVGAGEAHIVGLNAYV